MFKNVYISLKPNESKENQDKNIINIDMYDMEQDEEDDHENDDYEENTCLFKLFYQKLTKYFSDVIYTIESDEYRLENCEANTSSTAMAKSTNLPNSMHNESIITTIVAGNEKEEVDYKLEKDESTTSVEKRLPMSRSESDIFSELQSQTMPCESEDGNKKNNQQNQPSNNNNNNNNHAVQTSMASANGSNYSASSPSSTFTNNNSLNSYYSCVQLLQVEFLSKLITYLHNMQFFDALRMKLASKSLKTGANKKQKKCSCYNDMLVSFLIMIDYKFNEKFINGSRFDFNEFFLTPYKSACSFLLTKSSTDVDSNECSANSTCNSNMLG
jgi:hypothetical protein